jgi:hypothetical protein
MNMKMIRYVLFIFSIIYPLSITVADNDWPASECITNGRFDKDKCSEKATWIAVGTIKDIHLLSYPRDNPQSEFTLQVTKWEKGNSKIKSKKDLKYLEGYFARTPKAGNLVRVYGYRKVKHLPDKEYGVFYIEQLNEK